MIERGPLSGTSKANEVARFLEELLEEGTGTSEVINALERLASEKSIDILMKIAKTKPVYREEAIDALTRACGARWHPDPQKNEPTPIVLNNPKKMYPQIVDPTKGRING